MATLLERLDIVSIHQSVTARYCKEAAVEIRRLQAALLRHGVHDETCDVEVHGPDTCSCGFDAACFPPK
jgi:hypothetical protein